MYFAFMAAWLNLFLLLGQLAWVTLAAGLVAVVIGAVNVKDFFAFGQGVSLSISDSGQARHLPPRPRDRARRRQAAGDARRHGVPRVAANFYELLCTAGFPMVFTRLLTLHETGGAARYGYLALYNLIYVLPLVAIVVVFARTLGARKLGEREGRLLKLLSGLMMLELGALLLVAPERTSDVTLTLAMIAVALGATWVAARGTRPGAG
jgi:hypothetical protein